MDNVIRPTFGSRPEPQAEPAKGEVHPHRVYGIATGYVVALIRGRDDTLHIVVGPEAGSTFETVGIVPATAEGETDAERIGLAILRTLEIVGEAGRPGIG